MHKNTATTVITLLRRAGADAKHLCPQEELQISLERGFIAFVEFDADVGPDTPAHRDGRAAVTLKLYRGKVAVFIQATERDAANAIKIATLYMHVVRLAALIEVVIEVDAKIAEGCPDVVEPLAQLVENLDRWLLPPLNDDLHSALRGILGLTGAAS